MMLIFHLLLLLLNGIKILFTRRATALEHKYVRLAKEVNAMPRESYFKEGNSSRHDPFQAAKRQYLLGVLVEKKDRLEARHHRWAQRVEGVTGLIHRLQSWKGRLVPYALGAIDVMTSVCMFDYVNQGDFVVLRHLIGLVRAKFNV